MHTSIHSDISGRVVAALACLTISAALDTAPADELPAAAYNWSGLYIGGHAGGAWAKGAAFSQLDELFLSTRNQRVSLDESSFIGGAHAGYNWLVTQSWLAGIEADISWTDSSALGTAPNLDPPTGQPFPGGFLWARDVNWLASIRGRIGYLVTPPVLLYFTGGIAWTDIDYRGSYTEGGGSTEVSAFSETETGYVLGGGLEWMLSRNWLLRGEYLHYGFGSASVINHNPLFLPDPIYDIRLVWDDTEIQVGRVGLSYKFDN